MISADKNSHGISMVDHFEQAILLQNQQISHIEMDQSRKQNRKLVTENALLNQKIQQSDILLAEREEKELSVTRQNDVLIDAYQNEANEYKH